jgi:hypothetical protein
MHRHMELYNVIMNNITDTTVFNVALDTTVFNVALDTTVFNVAVDSFQCSFRLQFSM